MEKNLFFVCYYDYLGLAATYKCSSDPQQKPYLIRLNSGGDSDSAFRQCCGQNCCDLGRSRLETLQFWLWLILVFLSLCSFLFFVVYYSVRWKWSHRRRENLNPFLVAQLTTAGDYQTTEYAEDGIIVPKLFYKSSKDGSKKEEAIKDIISEADLRLIKEKIKDKDDEVIEKEDLSRDLEILEESNSKKIITEIVLQPQVRRSERSNKLMTRRTSNVPINTDPERPLEAMYQPSVPVVQVWDRSYRPRQFERIVYPPGFVNT